MLYTSVTNPKMKELRKLQQRKFREKKKQFLIEGQHLVLEAFKTGYLEELILEQDELFPLDIETSYVTNDILSYLSEVEAPQNIMGVAKMQEETTELGNRILILDGIQDPGNLGTIIRSAAAFHIDTIILGPGTVDLYNSKTIRASQGMIFHMNFNHSNLVTLIPELKKNNYQVLGTKVTHGKSLKSLEKIDKFAIIMGNEGNGISEDVEDLIDSFIYIDMNGVCESLNVGVATSIILYELDK